MSSGTANISIKKRRKPREGKEVVRDARETIMQTKKAKVDEVLENPLTWEDEDASARDPAQDAEVHSETCQEIRHLLARIHKSRQAGSSTDDEALQEDKIQLALLGINLKKLNRLGQIRCRISRESTSEAKYRVDSLHLQLQNLLYELMHLQKEITKCLQFKSADEEIDIVPVDEFYVEAPPSISRPDVTKSDKHQQYLSRLEWEREQRRRLAENCKEIKATKEETARQIQEKQAQLDSLLPRFKAILKATQPIQESLGMRLDEKRQQQETARYLPSPLYILYVQADAYREACDEKLCVTVEGIMEEVRSFQDDREDFDEDSAESDQEEAQAEKRHKKSRMEKLATKQKKLLSHHPLSVVLAVKCTDDTVLKLSFFYYTKLRIVTVTTTLTLAADAGRTTTISGGNLLAKESLLAYLLPGDEGRDTPNPSNHYQLSRLHMKEFASYVEDIGRPYAWAQRLAGLQFLETGAASSSSGKPSAAVSSSHIAQTIRALRKRVEARLALQRQMAGFERAIVPVMPDIARLFPARIISRLLSWKPSTYEEFVALPYTGTHMELQLATQQDMFYTAVAERNTARLTAQVVLGPDYPKRTPIFAISIFWNYERNATNDENVRAVETEVNMYCVGYKSHDQLLANQLQMLLLCFDVYLETASAGVENSGPTEISKEKIFLRVFRGRSRSKPFKYNPSLELYFHR